MLDWIEAELSRAFERVGNNDCARRILSPVDTVGVAGEGGNSWSAVECDRKAEQIFQVSATLSLRVRDGDRRLTARDDGAPLTVDRQTPSERRMARSQVPCLRLELVAQVGHDIAGLLRLLTCCRERVAGTGNDRRFHSSKSEAIGRRRLVGGVIQRRKDCRGRRNAVLPQQFSCLL